ncbi:MAG TPA: GGDEF domain-containing protein [Ruminiclostridium sp.]|nr:GGDEF domain-containing protein [Ruminiclostridium sp.]
MNKRMDKLRTIINEMITSDGFNREELAGRSQELDRLLLFFMQKNNYYKTVFGNRNRKEFDDFFEKLLHFDKLYDSIRIVDPVKKKVFEVKNAELFETDFVCYNFWKKKDVCSNCISMRAYNENDTIFKIEHHEDNIYTVAAVPVEIQGRTLVVEVLKNVTNILRSESENPEYGIKILSSIDYVNQAAVKDELTNLFNRRFVKEKLPNELFISAIKGEPLSVIYAELSYFSLIRDTYGESAGDHVLKQFAEELKDCISQKDGWAARYGAQEFILCAKNTDGAAAIAERIKNTVKQKIFLYGRHRINLNCRTGVYIFENNKEYPSVYEIIESLKRNSYA